MTSTPKKKYQRLTPIEHILKRPDMYCGNVNPKTVEVYVADKEFKIKKKTITIPMALLRVFIEPLSNAIDNASRSKGKNMCKSIKININQETGESCIWNDGDYVSVEIHEDENMYNHSLIFGTLLTSSNYDDEADRVDISGRNGVGVKVLNVYSKRFKVTGYDPDNKKTFTQVWTNNMRDTDGPDIKQKSGRDGYTSIEWIPDFKRFNTKGYNDDMISLFRKYAIDTAMLTKTAVYFNGELIPVRSLRDYANLYATQDRGEETKDELLFIKTSNCEVVLTPASEFETISFASGICTPAGGVHVDPWVEALFRPILKKKNKGKKITVNIREIKRFFRIFVVATVKNPTFESQSKNKLESPKITAVVKSTHVLTIMKWSVMEKIDDIIKAKEFGILKKSEIKRKGFTRVEGLDPANLSGGKRSNECVLIVCEGLSAKTFAVTGIETGAFGKKGRDYFGIFCLKGKVLNVRNASPVSISKNKVVTDLIRAMGIRHGVDYTIDSNYKSLKYGRIMILTDQDADGIHISALIQNIIHYLFPTLLDRKVPFITIMNTLIARVYQKGKDLLFYDENEYRNYVAETKEKTPSIKINRKYYKGLGTNNDSDIKETFGKRIVTVHSDENTGDNMTKAFHKAHSNDRKKWLAEYKPEEKTEVRKSISISDFINKQLIQFSINDCKRSIPHVMDGLKEGNRKVLFACFLRNLAYTSKTLKVAQLAGYTAEHAGYHHGEQNLFDTITKMANEFQGSNNIPLLYRDGQFGTILSNGKDAANARYIFTKLDAMTRLLFKKEDDVLLTRVEEDGDIVEPTYYAPIIPMILVNGCTTGIGTGWSCSVPCYNPIDIIEAVKTWIEFDGETTIVEDEEELSVYPLIRPWYRGYNGEIEKVTDEKFISWGKVLDKKGTKVVVELPIGMSSDSFKDMIYKQLESKAIQKVKDNTTAKKVKFTITESEDGFICNRKNLKLYTYIHTSNMVLFTEEGRIKKFKNIEEIISHFCVVRMRMYERRKQYMLNALVAKITTLDNKQRFLSEVMTGDISMMYGNASREEEDIVSDLKNREYDEGENGYDYLLRMQIRSFTKKNVDKIINELNTLNKERDLLFDTSPKTLWIADLNKFSAAYVKWVKTL
jgi:DNA topoisomerase-2